MMKGEKNTAELVAQLQQFTGTTRYLQLVRKVVITDGCLYLAEQAKCYWLLNLFASHLISIDGNKESFTCLKLTTDNQTAAAVIDDGNGNVLATQAIDYTDFPLDSIKLYGCWAGEFWVVMLPTEY